MIKEAIGFGNTIEEAKEDAILKLGAGIDEDIQFEIINMPKSKVLGLFGGARAEVRVYVERPDEKPAKKAPKNKKTQEKAPSNKKAQSKAPKEKKAVETKKAEPKEEKPNEVEIPQLSEAEIPADSKTGKAIAYLKNILDNLGCKDYTVSAAIRENGALISLDGEGLGVVIGHHGETLDALQHLVSLAANNGGGYFKVTLNIGNYREKREETLNALAKRVSAQVLKTSRSRTLEPMSAYERRIIHTAIQDVEGVVSSSVGEGKNRRVVIAPEGVEITASRRDNRRKKGGRDRRTSNTVASAPTREPKRDSDIPLYGKIQANTEK